MRWEVPLDTVLRVGNLHRVKDLHGISIDVDALQLFVANKLLARIEFCLSVGQAITYTCEDFITCACLHHLYMHTLFLHRLYMHTHTHTIIAVLFGISGFRGGVIMIFVVLRHIGCRSQDTPHFLTCSVHNGKHLHVQSM